jgi:hypothetical protein
VDGGRDGGDRGLVLGGDLLHEHVELAAFQVQFFVCLHFAAEQAQGLYRGRVHQLERLERLEL